MDGSMLKDAFGHHVWATGRLLEACEGLTEEQLAAAAPGTYGSIIATLRHLVGADGWYLFVLTGGEVPDPDVAEMGVAGLREVMEQHAGAWERLLASDLDPAQNVVWRRDDGFESHAPLGVRLAQAVHHGTDHRSQVCSTLTTLGIDPPPIDVWDYAEEGGRLKDVQPG